MDNSSGKRPPSGGASSRSTTGGKPYAGRKPAQGAKPSSKPYGKKRAYAPGDKPAPRPYGDKPAPRPYGDKPASDRKPYSDRPYSNKKPYSDNKPYSQGKPYAERKPFSGPKYAPKAPVAPREEETAVTEQQLQVLVSAIATEPVTSLSALAAHAKKRAARETLERIFADRAILYAALTAPEPKARKNAARVLGAFARVRDTDALIAALQTEETRFVIPSILLALGAIGGADAGKAITDYVPPVAADETEEKHVQDILEAHAKALASLEKDVPLPERTRLSTPREVLLVPPAGFGEILLKETTSRGFSATLHEDGVRVFTDQIKTLQDIRCSMEILLPLASKLPQDAEKIAAIADPVLTRPYRIELRNYTGDRAAFIHAVSTALGGGDNPSRYADELRIVCAKDTCDVFIRPKDVPDTRFAYRKRTLPASIHPVLASCLARYALSFVSAARPRTLDPFCGSGTMLLELERVVPTAMIGVDVSERALDAARENATAAHSGARFVHKDILKFEPREPFDLILTNMPFGNRVGTHSANEALYRDFVHALPKFIKSGGIAVLYTMEQKLLSACLASEPGLSVAAELTTEAGGLNPRVTVVRRQ